MSIHTCPYTCPYTHVHTHMSILACPYTHVRTHMPMSTYTCPHTCLHTSLQICPYTCPYTHVHTHMSIHTCPCTHMSIRTFLWVLLALTADLLGSAPAGECVQFGVGALKRDDGPDGRFTLAELAARKLFGQGDPQAESDARVVLRGCASMGREPHRAACRVDRFA